MCIDNIVMSVQKNVTVEGAMGNNIVKFNRLKSCLNTTAAIIVLGGGFFASSVMASPRVLTTLGGIEVIIPNSNDWCKDTVALTLSSANPADFKGDIVNVRSIMAALPMILQFECSKAKSLVIEGKVDQKTMLTGFANKSNGWKFAKIEAESKPTAKNTDIAVKKPKPVVKKSGNDAPLPKDKLDNKKPKPVSLADNELMPRPGGKNMVQPVKKIVVDLETKKKMGMIMPLTQKVTRESKTKLLTQDQVQNIEWNKEIGSLVGDERKLVLYMRGKTDDDGKILQEAEAVAKYIDSGKIAPEKLSTGLPLSAYILSEFFDNKNYSRDMRQFVKKHASWLDFNQYLLDGSTPLIRWYQTVAEAPTRLLAEGANANMAHAVHGATPLHQLLYTGRKSPFKMPRSGGYVYYALAIQLLAYGADVNAVLTDDWNREYISRKVKKSAKIAPKGATPLMIAMMNRDGGPRILAQLLVDNGADVNMKDAEGNTALNYITLPKRNVVTLEQVVALLSYLVEKGADPLHKGSDGQSVVDKLLKMYKCDPTKLENSPGQSLKSLYGDRFPVAERLDEILKMAK